MAIEIISVRMLPEKQQFEGTCSYCKTKIKCLQEDGQLHHGDQRDPGRWISLTCPTCKKTMNAYPKSIPAYRGSGGGIAYQINNPVDQRDR